MPVTQSKTAELLEDAPKKNSFGIASRKNAYGVYMGILEILKIDNLHYEIR